MKYTNVRAFEKHLKEASFSSATATSHFSPLYLVILPDDFVRRQTANHLTQSLLTSPINTHNKRVFEGGKDKISTLLHELRSLSLFAKKRVVMLEKGEELSKEEMATLESTFSSIPHSVYLIICASAINRSTRFYKQAEKAGVILDVEQEKPWEKQATLAKKVTEIAKNEGKSIDPAVALELVRWGGDDTGMLFHELEKLLTYVGENTQVTQADLRAICIGKNHQTAWQLGEALLTRRGGEALRIAHELLQEGEPLFALLRQLRVQFQSRLYAATEPGEEVLKRYPYLRGSLLQKHIHEAKLFGIHACQKAIMLIDETELEGKNSSLSHELLLEKLFFKLLV